MDNLLELWTFCGAVNLLLYSFGHSAGPGGHSAPAGGNFVEAGKHSAGAGGHVDILQELVINLLKLMDIKLGANCHAVRPGGHSAGAGGQSV